MNKRLQVLVLITVLFTMSFYACGNWVSRDSAISWLRTLQTDSTTIDISGNWNGPSDVTSQYVGWGRVTYAAFDPIIMIQKDQQITGVWGDYSIEGIISDKKVTFVALYDNWVYYTFHMTVTPNGKALIGKYCDGYVEYADGCSSITLQKSG